MPKGDAENLRADIDDGHVKVANLLLESLICAPLSGAEYSVILFIIRRTYGWARPKDRSTGKLNAMTAGEIADGTVLSRAGVHKALQALTKAEMIVREVDRTRNEYSYGVNPDISQWGLMSVEWKECKQQLRDARERGVYTTGGSVVHYKRLSRPLQTAQGTATNGAGQYHEQLRAEPRTGQGDDTDGAEVGHQTPTGSGPETTSTASKDVQPERRTTKQQRPLQTGVGDFVPTPTANGLSNGDTYGPQMMAKRHEFGKLYMPYEPDRMDPGTLEGWEDCFQRWLVDPDDTVVRVFIESNKRHLAEVTARRGH